MGRTTRNDSAAYWGEDGLEAATACLACGGAALSTAVHGLEDLLGRLPGQWGFEACKQCGALNLDPRPTQQAIGKAYPPDYVTHADGDDADARDNGPGAIWAACNAYLNSRFGCTRVPASRATGWLVRFFPTVRLQLDYFFRHLPRTPGRLLDVGCGNGAFLRRAATAGWKASGIEPDPEAVAAARAEGVDVVHATIESFEPATPFDQITLSHVFEHLHEPQRALARIHGWLASGGRLWMALPNPESIGFRIFGRNWFALDPPRHLCLPPQAQVRGMLERAGFVDVQFLSRGRGSKSSILPSQDYARVRGGRPRHGATLLSRAIDLLTVFNPAYGEETVVIARRR